MNFYLKKITRNDTNFLYNLRNTSIVRKNSINDKNKINIAEHKKWFKNAKKKSLILIAYLNRTKIGAVRYDKNEFYHYVSIAIKPTFHNKGFGNQMLQQSEKFIKNNSILIAKIKKNNSKSIKIFLKNGYSILKKSKLVILFKVFRINSKSEIYSSIISKIELIRKKNNVNWMSILKLCFSLDPDRTKLIFKKINFEDNQINKLSKKILLEY
jgi:hypothetical protein